jgi:hypothetical protein
MTKCSPSLAIKEKQIKTMLRFHLTPVRMAIFKSINNNIGEDVGEKGLSYTAGENVKQYGGSSKNLKYNCCMIQKF